MVVAPASTAMRTISTRKSRSERVASSGENSTSSHQGARQAHGFAAEVQGLLAADLELVFEMQVAGGEEDVDAGAVGELHGAGGHLDVFGSCAGQRGDARLADGLGDGGDGREVALRGHGEAGLDDVHAQVLEGMGHGQLFLRGHAAAGRLLAVAQGGVEEEYVSCVHALACPEKHLSNSASVVHPVS